MREETRFRLSVEEVAVALTQMGKAETGRQLLGPLCDDDPEAIDNRLFAAGHSLIARGLLDVVDEGTVLLDPEFKEILTCIAEGNRTLRFSRTDAGREVVLLLHALTDGAFISQVIEREVVYELATIRKSEAFGSCRDLFGIQDFPEAGEPAEWWLPLVTLTDLDSALTEQEAVEVLVQAGLPEIPAHQLASANATAIFRGSIASIAFSASSEENSQEGSMILCSPTQCWLFDITPGDTGLLRLRARIVGSDELADRILEFIEDETLGTANQWN